jgi:hypothetical protein
MRLESAPLPQPRVCICNTDATNCEVCRDSVRQRARLHVLRGYDLYPYTEVTRRLGGRKPWRLAWALEGLEMALSECSGPRADEVRVCIDAVKNRQEPGSDYWNARILQAALLSRFDPDDEFLAQDALPQNGIHVVYFAAGYGRIKIGTTANLRQRLRQLSSGPDSVRMLCFEPGDEWREQQLHDQFKASCSRNEWFNPTEDLLAYIKALQANRDPWWTRPAERI